MFGSLITIAGLVANALREPTIPSWIWITLGYVMLLLAPFFAFKKIHDDFWKLKAEYNDPTLVICETRIDQLQAVGAYAARIGVRHTGPRSVGNVGVRIIALAPIIDNAGIRALCDELTPVWLGPKNSRNGSFELHSSPMAELIEVANCNRHPEWISLGHADPSDRETTPICIPVRDYVAVIEVKGHNAKTAMAACAIRITKRDSGLADEPESELVFQQLTTPIADVLDGDHPLAKEFDQRIVPPHPVAS
jgi:hypothetical protein